jgi:hypothetical protein
LSKKIIVIGGGGSLLEKKNGHKIDSFDYVVRMGECKIKGYEAYVGTKTDMFRVAWKNHFCYCNNVVNFVNTELQGFNDILLTEARDSDDYHEVISLVNKKSHYAPYLYKDVSSGAVVSYDRTTAKSRILFEGCMLWFLQNHSQVKSVYYYDMRMRVQLIASLQRLRYGVLPSHGLYTIDYIINTFPNDDIYITGFDGFKHDYYWRNHVNFHNNHCGVTEQLYLKRLKKTGRLSIL